MCAEGGAVAKVVPWERRRVAPVADTFQAWEIAVDRGPLGADGCFLSHPDRLEGRRWFPRHAAARPVCQLRTQVMAASAREKGRAMCWKKTSGLQGGPLFRLVFVARDPRVHDDKPQRRWQISWPSHQARPEDGRKTVCKRKDTLSIDGRSWSPLLHHPTRYVARRRCVWRCLAVSGCVWLCPAVSGWRRAAARRTSSIAIYLHPSPSISIHRQAVRSVASQRQKTNGTPSVIAPHSGIPAPPADILLIPHASCSPTRPAHRIRPPASQRPRWDPDTTHSANIPPAPV